MESRTIPNTGEKTPAEIATGENRAAETEAVEETAGEAAKIDIDFSKGLAGFLATRNISIAFTSYQTGRLYLIGHGKDGKLALHEALYPQAMGVTGDSNRLYLGTLTQLVRLENVLASNQLANEVHDKVYVPRNMQTLGNIDFHEVGICENGVVVFVNTKYSCLCEPSLTHSFRPIWKPDFISKLAPEDRCHLNGLAMVDGRPKYVTAVCKSDVIDGWRDRRHDSGVVIDVETDEIVAEGLSMPHSPRWHDGRLWLLNSGTGELGWIDMEKKSFVPFAFCPGFTRGLALHKQHAIIGLSKPRHGRFEGLALDERLKEKDADAWCGLQCLSLSSGDVIQWLRFDGAITELFDVCVLPGVKNALTLGPQSNEVRDFITIENPP
ncbi:TIGR03032 family protein [Parasphingopyxis sp.]|uniref:TIGR03032 family protein n=1 Tax=Parasphingopyxis sp. TaxID=1920299 RepID=UPI00262727E2|nr:TIGR03032 family protein [Parasphingopyxis sp.]